MSQSIKLVKKMLEDSERLELLEVRVEFLEKQMKLQFVPPMVTEPQYQEYVEQAGEQVEELPQVSGSESHEGIVESAGGSSE